MLCYINDNKNKYGNEYKSLDKEYFVGNGFGGSKYITLSPSSYTLSNQTAVTLLTQSINQYVNQMYININLLCEHSFGTSNPYPMGLQFKIYADGVTVATQIVPIHPQKYCYCNFFQIIPINKTVTTLKININATGNGSTNIILSPAVNAQQFVILQ